MGLKGRVGKMMLGKNPSAPPNPTLVPTPTAAVAPVQKPWDATAFRIQLKLARSRMELQAGKKTNEMDATRRNIAEHLAANKETLARIHGERLLRELSQVQAFDVVQTFIELLSQSNNVFMVNREFDQCATDIKESVASVCFASSRMNVPELQTVCAMFRAHFGPAAVDPLARGEGPHLMHVNKILARSLEGGTPDGYLVLQELSKIASDFNVAWMPPPEFPDLDGGMGPSDPGYYRPVPLQHPHHMPGGPSGPSAPPPDDDGSGGGGGGAAFPAMNIPGHNPYGGGGGFGHGMPPGVPGGAAPPHYGAPAPFDPGMGAPGTLYPSAPPSAGGYSNAPSHSVPPPPPPPASFLSDEALEAKFRNVRDNYGK